MLQLWPRPWFFMSITKPCAARPNAVNLLFSTDVEKKMQRIAHCADEKKSQLSDHVFSLQKLFLSSIVGYLSTLLSFFFLCLTELLSCISNCITTSLDSFTLHNIFCSSSSRWLIWLDRVSTHALFLPRTAERLPSRWKMFVCLFDAMGGRKGTPLYILLLLLRQIEFFNLGSHQKLLLLLIVKICSGPHTNWTPHSASHLTVCQSCLYVTLAYAILLKAIIALRRELSLSVKVSLTFSAMLKRW